MIGSAQSTGGLLYTRDGNPNMPYVGMELGTEVKPIRAWVHLCGVATNKKLTSLRGSSTNYITYQCHSDKCPYVLIFSRGKTPGNIYLVTKVTTHANCAGVAQPSTSTIVAAFGHELAGQDPKVGGKVTAKIDLINQSTKFQSGAGGLSSGSKADYHRVWRASREVGVLKTDPFSEGFALLPAYLAELEAQNPGSITVLETEPDDEGNGVHFKRAFVMLGAMAEAFSNCKPYTSIDAGFLKHVLWEKFVFAVAGSSDGNRKDVLGAFAWMSVENTDNYKWFIQNMIRHPKVKEWMMQPGFVAVSDRDKGLKAAIAEVLPDAIPQHCARHLLGNVPGPSFTKGMRTLYWAAVYAEESFICEEYLDELAKLNPTAVAYLRKIPPGLWCRHAIDSHFMGFVTNGAAERQVNWVGPEFRSLSPVLGMKKLFGKLANQRVGHAADVCVSLANKLILTPDADEMVTEQLKQSGKFTIQSLGNGRFQVALLTNPASSSGRGEEARAVTLILEELSKEIWCSCRPAEYIPCRHIIAVLKWKKSNSLLYGQPEVFFPSHFFLKTLKASYQQTIFSCAEKTDLTSSPTQGPKPKPKNGVHRKPGPKSFKRIRSRYQHHTGDTSGAPVPTNASSTASSCSFCHLPGHSEPICPLKLSKKDTSIINQERCRNLWAQAVADEKEGRGHLTSYDESISIDDDGSDSESNLSQSRDLPSQRKVPMTISKGDEATRVPMVEDTHVQSQTQTQSGSWANWWMGRG